MWRVYCDTRTSPNLTPLIHHYITLLPFINCRNWAGRRCASLVRLTSLATRQDCWRTFLKAWANLCIKATCRGFCGMSLTEWPTVRQKSQVRRRLVYPWSSDYTCIFIGIVNVACYYEMVHSGQESWIYLRSVYSWSSVYTWVFSGIFKSTNLFRPLSY